ncbi:MAG TPA: glycerol kinase GlpK [Clostridia bacterium]|nr:glycerol kinase GlpK [Clostridia bacterium]
MDRRYLVALDQGTTSSRAIVFTLAGSPVSAAAQEFTQHYPRPGWVEHQPEDLLDTTLRALRGALEQGGIQPSEIAAIGIANQRETTLIWERETGKPLGRAIVWQCRRTAPLVERLKQDGLAWMIQGKTGLVPDAYFSATKIRWLLDEAGAQARAERGELCFGTVDSFLAWHLVKGRPHVTDATNASRTMLFNLEKQDWDEELLRLFNIPRALLPRVADTAELIGTLDDRFLGAPVPVAALAGDQHAALFGQGCFQTGEVKNTYGTGCFMLMNTGDRPVSNDKGLLSTMAWRLDGRPAFALEGSVFVAGAAIQWLRDELGVIGTAAQSQELALKAQDSGGVHFVPAFTGLGAPHWDMYARGTITGLSRGTGAAHLARAALESIAFQSNDLLALMADSLGHRPRALKVDGGAAANDLLMQMQADISGIRVLRPQVRETTALGAALLAGLGVKLFDSPAQAAARWQLDRAFEPAWTPSLRAQRLDGWSKAVRTALFEASLRDNR